MMSKILNKTCRRCGKEFSPLAAMQKNCDPCREKARIAASEAPKSMRGRPRKDPMTGGGKNPALRISATVRGDTSSATKRHVAALARSMKSAIVGEEDAPSAPSRPPRVAYGAKPIMAAATAQFISLLPRAARDAIKRGMGEWTAAKRGAFCVVQVSPTQFGVHVPGSGIGFSAEQVLAAATLGPDGRWRIEKGAK
jgi:hypothetical protein